MWIVGSSFRPRLPAIHGCAALSLAVESTGRAREGAALQPCTAVDQHRTHLWIFRSESLHTGVYGGGAPEPGAVAADARLGVVARPRGGVGASSNLRHSCTCGIEVCSVPPEP